MNNKRELWETARLSIVGGLIGLTIGQVINLAVQTSGKPVVVTEHRPVKSPPKKRLRYMDSVPDGARIEHFIAWQFTDPGLEKRLAADTNVVLVKEDNDTTTVDSFYVELKRVRVRIKNPEILCTGLYILPNLGELLVEYIPLGNTNQVTKVSYTLRGCDDVHSRKFFNFNKLDSRFVDNMAWALSTTGMIETLENSNAVKIHSKTHDDAENQEYTHLVFIVTDSKLFESQIGVKGARQVYSLSVEYVMNSQGFPNIYQLEISRRSLPYVYKTWGDYKNEKSKIISDWKERNPVLRIPVLPPADTDSTQIEPGQEEESPNE